MEAGIGKTAFLDRLNLRFKCEEGLTLIEIMVSMMIFLVVSAGIAGTLMTGLRTTVSARQSTFAKETAQAQIEEMRAKTFYVPYSDDPGIGTKSDFDLLDRYYPDLNTTPTVDDQVWTGQYFSGSDAHYTRISPPDTHGIVTTVETRFVDSNRIVVVPPSSYDSNSADNDTPPSKLVDVKVTAAWGDRSGEQSYVLESLISATGQTPPVTESGCEHASNSRVDVKGLILTASTGTADPYTALVNGTLGDAHAAAVYGCESDMEASATGGQMSVVGGSTYTGATVLVTGPPAIEDVVGPLNVGPPGTWPKPTISNSKAKGEIEDKGSGKEVGVEGEANVGTQSLQLEQVSGTPTNDMGSEYCMGGYKRWDFINPTITVNGAGGGDDGEDIEAEIEQKNGDTTGTAEVGYQQVNILPLQKWPTSTTDNPSAAQGIVFIRDFKAKAEAKANGTPSGASTTMTYSFTLYMFNPNKSGCTYSSTGDTCYDPYSISPSNPLQNVLLSNSNYRLQNELMTEWYSYTTSDITNAMYAAADGTTATITADALVKISAKYGVEINWKTNNPHKDRITLVSQLGLQKTWLGKIDISVEQHG